MPLSDRRHLSESFAGFPFGVDVEVAEGERLPKHYVTVPNVHATFMPHPRNPDCNPPDFTAIAVEHQPLKEL